MNREINSGIKSTYFPWFNRVLKGFRKGEFSIFTGPTGSGKTTFLSQLSLDFAKSGVPTLWCSFELKNEILLSTMLNQFAGFDLLKEPQRFDYFADQFEKVPLYFQTYFGSTHVDDVICLIDYAIYTHDISHIVIDNLQFMMSGQGRGIERFEMQDDVVSKLRHLATTRDVHITLVIHPRKGEDGSDLTLSSIFGTAKSTQEADNVMILQHRDKYRVVEVKKNRYDGETGRSSLWFDRSSKRFEQISTKEIEELLTGAKLHDILSRKQREIKEEYSEDVQNTQNVVLQSSQRVSPDIELQNILKENAKRLPNDKNYSQVFSFLEGMVELENKSSNRFTNQQTVYRQAGQESNQEQPIRTLEAAAVKVSSSGEEEDIFDIKFEGSYSDIDKVISDSKVQEETQTSSGSRVQVQTEGSLLDTAIKRTALGGMQQHNDKIMSSMYGEGEAVYTYDDMIQELVEKGNDKYKRFATASEIKYKGGGRGPKRE